MRDGLVAFLCLVLACCILWCSAGCDDLAALCAEDAGTDAALVDAAPPDAGAPDAEVFTPCSVEPPNVTCWDAGL